MKPKLFAAPLLSLTLLLIFFYPLQNSDLILKYSPPGVSSLALSGGMSGDAKTDPRAAEEQTAGPDLAPSTPVVTVQPPPGSGMSAAEIEGFSLELDRFIPQVSDPQSSQQLRGVHVAGTLALRVEQQPTGETAYVSALRGIATQFKSAADNGVTGLLAHNYLSGELFYGLKPGQEVHLVYGNGRVKAYQVTEIERYQKLDPASLRSDLIQLSTGLRFTTNQIFNRYYDGGDHVTFQTCLAGQGISNWGLIFIIAEPLR